MYLLVSGATPTVRRLQASSPRLGVLLTPRAGGGLSRRDAAGTVWACDNSAFSDFCPVRFCRMMALVAGLPGCKFVTAPDVVGDCDRTLERFDRWQPVMRELGLPVAYVGQDGAEDRDLPWGRMQALFVGGGTAWKESAAARDLCHEAKRRGKWVHVGRVNTKRRVEIARLMRADSIDGTSFSRWPDSKIPAGLRWVHGAAQDT